MRNSVRFVLGAIALTTLAPTGARAQIASGPGASPSVMPANILPAGTELVLRLRHGLDSRRSRVGDLFEMYVAEPVAVNGVTVIPAGSTAIGEVTRVRHRKSWGRRGIVETSLSHVWVGDHRINITGRANDRGHPGTAPIVAGMLLSPLILGPIAGFAITGTSAEIPGGTAIVAYIDQDVRLPLEPAYEPQPLTELAGQTPA